MANEHTEWVGLDFEEQLSYCINQRLWLGLDAGQGVQTKTLWHKARETQTS